MLDEIPLISHQAQSLCLRGALDVIVDGEGVGTDLLEDGVEVQHPFMGEQSFHDGEALSDSVAGTEVLADGLEVGFDVGVY